MTLPAREEWCLGLKLVQERQLSSEEIQDLRREGRSRQGRGCAWGCGFPVVFLILIAAFAALTERFGYQAPAWLQMPLMAAMFGVPAWCFLVCNDHIGRARGLKRDATDGKCKQFVGHLSPETLHTATTPVIVRALGSAEVQTIEVLPASNRLWKINGVLVDQWQKVQATSAVAAPVQAQQSAQWARTLNAESDDWLQRPLSDDEKAELLDYAKRHVRGPSRWAIGFNLWLALPLALHWFFKTPLRMEPIGYFLFAMALLSNWNWWRVWRLSSEWRQDAQTGFAVVARFEDAFILEETEDESLEPTPQTVEILPVSQTLWLVDNQPAPWRLQADVIDNK